MDEKMIVKKGEFVYLSVAWVVLWLVPWGGISFGDNLYITFFVDMMKLGVAIGVFVIPGVLLHLLLWQEGDRHFASYGTLPIGFAISVSIIGVIGIVGRLLGLSFILVKYSFALIGLSEILLLACTKPDKKLLNVGFTEIIYAVGKNTPLSLALILATAMTFNGYQFFIDDTTYAAYLTNWQNSSHLGFSNIVHQLGIVEQSRFWLALYPMGQALLSDLSGVPGILLFSNYIELFLVPLAVLTAYWFARVLGLSRKMAGYSVLLQVFFYVFMIDDSWPVGFWFFQNMAEDKVSAAFLLAPVFFVFVKGFLQVPGRKSGFLVFLTGVGLMLTHPVILFLSCVISMGVVSISWLVKKTNCRYVFLLFTLFCVVMLPYIAIRYFASSAQSITFDAEGVINTFQADRYVNVVSDVYYGLNPNVLMLMNISPESDLYAVFQIFRYIPIVLVLISGFLALQNVRKGMLYWYVLICVLLIAFATIPFTGWVLGYFISARMLPRVSWFLPLGIAGALVISTVSEPFRSLPIFSGVRKSLQSSNINFEETAKRILTSFVFSIILILFLVIPHAPTYFENLNHNRQLAQLGSHIDDINSESVTVIALDYGDIQLLPSVSAHASLISFREEKVYNPHNYFMNIEEIHARINASNMIRSLDSSSPIDKRCILMNEYHVKYVLTTFGNADLFESLVSSCGGKVSNVFETRNLILLEYR